MNVIAISYLRVNGRRTGTQISCSRASVRFRRFLKCLSESGVRPEGAASHGELRNSG